MGAVADFRCLSHLGTVTDFRRLSHLGTSSDGPRISIRGSAALCCTYVSSALRWSGQSPVLNQTAADLAGVWRVRESSVRGPAEIALRAVRGAPGDRRPYRDPAAGVPPARFAAESR